MQEQPRDMFGLRKGPAQQPSPNESALAKRLGLDTQELAHARLLSGHLMRNNELLRVFDEAANQQAQYEKISTAHYGAVREQIAKTTLAPQVDLFTDRVILGAILYRINRGDAHDERASDAR